MIAFTRTASIAPGKVGSALLFAREIAGHLQAHYDVRLEVQMPIGGNPNRVRWSAHYDSMAAWESLMGRLMADPVYMALVAKGGENFIAGSLEDALWRTL